ncbi:FAD:protein FMN transferase [Marinomonas sp. A79]|uniref:FAD:protein FMN transferase n=1 Tax=Marinomonas vulgaris TaxID=2823372 RepID=A0ABS5HFC8_9GAMM|nr:FAD:protein FMN transferase [Marinomonas vulgaris]MBR7890107.1 FAD:protein FMN transferase [Marinomonas vulgaris]
MAFVQHSTPKLMQKLTIEASLNPNQHAAPELWSEGAPCYRIQFECMASDCSMLVESHRVDLVIEAAKKAIIEAWRIENTFSRYQSDNTFAVIHSQPNVRQTLNQETAQLMLFAHHAHQVSGGLFDITSGILRQAWRFNGSDKVPSQEQIQALLVYVGWEKLGWSPQHPDQLCLPQGMELDFGGIGKEYAVDKMLKLFLSIFGDVPVAVLINGGGDIACSGPRLNGQGWRVGIESLAADHTSDQVISLSSGALATSGDSRRFLLKSGVRYSHVLNPLTGWPVENAPRSVTVAAPNCVNAGILATLSLLQGNHADAFLKSLAVPHWIHPTNT